MTDEWRDRDVEGLDERVRGLAETVARLLAHEAMFENDRDHAAATETRSYAALLRSRLAGYTDRARALRADQADSEKPLPMYFSRRT